MVEHEVLRKAVCVCGRSSGACCQDLGLCENAMPPNSGHLSSFLHVISCIIICPMSTIERERW